VIAIEICVDGFVADALVATADVMYLRRETQVAAGQRQWLTVADGGCLGESAKKRTRKKIKSPSEVI
jgi:hypothetical protein